MGMTSFASVLNDVGASRTRRRSIYQAGQSPALRYGRFQGEGKSREDVLESGDGGFQGYKTFLGHNIFK